MRTKRKLATILMSLVMVLTLVATINVNVDAASTTLTLTEDMTVSSAYLSDCRLIHLENYTLTVTDDFKTNAKIYIENGKLVVNGNFETTGDMILSYGEVVVNGNFEPSGQFQVDSDFVENAVGKKFTVKGDFISRGNLNSNFDMNVTGDFVQNNGHIASKKTNMSVGGDVIINSGYFNCDTLTVGGSFNYNSIDSNYNSSIETLNITGNISQVEDTSKLSISKLILAGTNQTVKLRANSAINEIKSENGNFSVDGYLNELKLTSDLEPMLSAGSLSTNKMDLNGYSLVVNGDLMVESHSESSHIFQTGKGSLKVTGNMTVSNDFNCEGTADIVGNYVQDDGQFFVTGKFSVGKNIEFNDNCKICSLDKGTVEVGGDLLFNSAVDTSSINSKWTVSGSIIQGKDAGKLLFGSSSTVTMTGDNTKITLTNGTISNLVLDYGKNHYAITPKCYTNLVATSELTFDAVEGTVDTASKKIKTKEAYGELPVPTKQNYLFDGWYTEKEEGTQILSDTIVEGVEDMTLYAHWTPGKAPSDNPNWYMESGIAYWFEDGVKQGTEGRGKEIYDADSDAWYWLDGPTGAMATAKDVYQESFAGEWGDKFDENGAKIGKWVRYDADGHMIKGWCSGSGEDAKVISSSQEDKEKPVYYFDLTYGTMAKGFASVMDADGVCREYYFNPETGILDRSIATVEVKEKGWVIIDGKEYWYENYSRSGYSVDGTYRGKEIYDEASDAWYWLDNVEGGKKAVSKDVYQESLAGDWGDIDNGDGTKNGKWVRYDSNGRMIKGWCAGKEAEAKVIAGPDAAYGADVYYFDYTYGTMAKGTAVIDGVTYTFDQNTGVLIR